MWHLKHKADTLINKRNKQNKMVLNIIAPKAQKPDAFINGINKRKKVNYK